MSLSSDVTQSRTRYFYEALGNLLTQPPSQNGLDEIEEQFYESQENRARILNSLYDKNLPVDVSQSFLQLFCPYFTLFHHLAFPNFN
jgi:hypothetical protein